MPWITAKYRGVCVGCDLNINEGDKIFLIGREVYCDECGVDAAKESGEDNVVTTTRTPDKKRYNI